MEFLQNLNLSEANKQIHEQELQVCSTDSKRYITSSTFEVGGGIPICEEQSNEAILCHISEPVTKKCDVYVETAEDEIPTKYYAVSFPSSSAPLIEEDHPLIFRNKSDALVAIKQYPNARFREFTSRIDAVKYACMPLSNQPTPSLKDTGEKTAFKSVTSQEMVQLRKAIESGNEILFVERVWSNPRYLINNADGPTVMQEGTRYNGLHVAVRFKQTGMCLTILSVIHDKQFISTMYPEDKPTMIEERIKHLVDLYLNMPDKSLSETPVHFACKFGCDSILAILLSYPECDINKLNKYGLSPKEVICDRHVCDSVDHKKRMLAMFEEIFYVPVVRDVTHNFIGEPCHASAVLTTISSSLASEEKHVTYCAFAGPMSESSAAKFCTLLKTKRFTEKSDLQNVPFSPEEKTLLQICLSDSKKGLERVGRKLAKDLSTGWLEFWDPLDCWLDLASELGLDYLNNHLKKQDEMMNSGESGCRPFNEFIISFTDDFVQRLPVILMNMSKMTFFHLFHTLVQHMCCFTKFSFSKEKEISLIHEEIGHLLYLKLSTDNKNNFDALKFYLNTQFNVVGSLQAPKWKMFLCVLKFACYFQASNALFLKVPICNCEYVEESDFFDYSSMSCYFSVLSLRQQFANDLSDKSMCATERASTFVKEESSSESSAKETAIIVDEKKREIAEETHTLINRLSLDCDMMASCDNVVVEKSKPFLSTSGIYHLIKKLKYMYEPPQDCIYQENLIKSENSLEDEDDDEKFFTPPESPSKTSKIVFVNDEEMSDDDIDIFRAIVDAGVPINRIEYPYVFKWKCLMESKLEPVLKLDDKISCTPTSSSATVRRAVTPKMSSLKRTLF